MWKWYRRVTRNPLFDTAIAVYFFVLMIWTDSIWIGFTAGLFAAMAVNKWIDWEIERERKKRRLGT